MLIEITPSHIQYLMWFSILFVHVNQKNAEGRAFDVSKFLLELSRHNLPLFVALSVGNETAVRD